MSHALHLVLQNAYVISEKTSTLCNVGLLRSVALDICRDGKSLLFVSERDGNMELYKYHLEGADSNSKSLKRLTYTPSLQVDFSSRPLLCHERTLRLTSG